MPRHFYLSRSIRMRSCYYCQAPIATALYLPALKAWACVVCYVAHYVHPPQPTPVGTPELVA
jgi:hypothetical protein